MSQPVLIGEIEPASFGVGKHLIGQIIAIKPFTTGTKLASLQIKSLATSTTQSIAVPVNSIEIQLKGIWATKAIGSFAVGQAVVISSEHAKVVAKPSSSLGRDGKSIYRIEFEAGIKGFITMADGEQQAFDHVNPQLVGQSRLVSCSVAKIATRLTFRFTQAKSLASPQ